MTSYEDGYGDEQARDTGVVLPAPSDYPVALAVGGVEASKKAGTPGVDLTVTVVDGAFKGATMRNFDSIVYLTPGRKGNNIGWVNHVTHQITGERPDYAAFERYGCPPPGADKAANATALAAWFAGLSPDKRVAFVKEYARTAKWDGATCMVSLDIEQEARVDDAGNPVLDPATGNQIIDQRNRIVNFWSNEDSKHGYAAWAKTLKAQQQEVFEAMQGGA